MPGTIHFSTRRHGRGIKPIRGTMNKTEAKYAEHLALRLRAGEILMYEFEAVTLKLGHNCRITPDFLVQSAVDDVLELHDTKGRTSKNRPFAEDDAIVKLKTLARLYPFRVFIVWPQPQFAGWNMQEIPAT